MEGLVTIATKMHWGALLKICCRR